jgi:hypothetical protein
MFAWPQYSTHIQPWFGTPTYIALPLTQPEHKTVNLYSKIKIHDCLHLTNSHSHYSSKTEGKKLKEQTKARQLLSGIMTITGFIKTCKFVQTLLGAAQKWIKTRHTHKNRHDGILKLHGKGKGHPARDQGGPRGSG